MSYQFDPDRYRESRGPSLPEGEYDAEIVRAYEDTSRSGRPMWVLELVTADGGKKLGRYYILQDTEHTDRNMGDVLSSIGADTGKAFSLAPQKLEGKVGKVYVVHDGQYLKVKWFVPRQPGDAVPRERTSATGRPFTPPPPPKPAQAEAQDGDDDIPF